MYFEHKKLEKKYEEQQKDLLKYRNHYKGRTTNKAPAPQDKKIKLSNIEFDEEKLRNLLTAQRKHDVYSDDGIESGEKFSESSDEEIVKKKKKTLTKKRTVAKTKTTKPAKKRRKNNKRNYKLYKQLIK